MAKGKELPSQRVLVPPSRHITTSFQELVGSLAGKGSQQEEYQTLAELLDASTLHDFQLVRRRLKQNFKPFSDVAAGNKMELPSNSSKEDLDSLELEFMDDFCSLLQAAHFKVLTGEEWQSACDNDFTFTNPLEAAWENMDQSLLRRFWRQREDDFINAASISEKVLVMHRGIHLSRAQGMFLEDKIDFLVLYLIAGPLERLFRPLLQFFFKGDLSRVWPQISVIDTVKDAGLSHQQRENQAPGYLRQSSSTRDPLLDHENARWVKRVTLKELMPNSAAVFKLLFKQITIQEPTFRDAIILYRRSTKSEAQKVDEKAPLKDAKPEDLVRNIHIKRFQDIPIADLEMIFPDKKVFLKPLLLFQLMVTIIIGLASVIVTVLTTEASWSLIGAVLSIIGTRAFQVWSSAQLGRQRVLDQITERLYEQTMDAQDGVIYFLLDQMADQHVKELLLAYFLLLQLGKPLTQKELDEHCEAYLKQTFKEPVDFALEKSLPVLLEDGLITKDQAGKLQPVSLEEARKLLSRKGQKYFASDSSGSTSRSNLPILSKLSAKTIGGVKADRPAASPQEKKAEEPISIPQPLGTAASPWNKSPASEEARAERGSRITTGLKSMLKSMKKDS